MTDDTNNINVDKNNNLSGSLLIIIVIFLGMFIGICIQFIRVLDEHVFSQQKEITTTSSSIPTTLSNTTSNTVTISNDKQLLFINHVDKLVKNIKYCSIKDYSDDNELYIVCDNYKIIFNQKEKQVDKIEIAVTVIENNSIVLESAGDPIYV